jgi:hypothetical protein
VICKVRGVVACREGDPPFHFYTELHSIQVFHKYLWISIHGPLPSSTQDGSFDPEQPWSVPHPPNNRAGPRVHVWAREAGFDPDRIIKDASVTVMATQEKKDYLADKMIARIETAGHRAKFVKLRATDEEVDGIVKGLRLWKDDRMVSTRS